jgi:hypothetical protein
VKVPDDEVKVRSARKRKYNARKVDYEKANEENALLGDAGERFALEWERARLRGLGVPRNTAVDEVIHVSKKFGDGSGYDILSKKDLGGKPRYIEVKTTKGKADTPFYMSRNEKAFMEEFREDAVIYRVYDFDAALNKGEVLVLTYDDLERGYEFEAVAYRVSKQ